MTTTETQDELSQRRRELASKVSELTTDLERQRKTVASLGVVLRASNIETRPAKEQKRLRAIRDALFAAERELTAFDDEHPGVELIDLFQEEVTQCQQQ